MEGEKRGVQPAKWSWMRMRQRQQSVLELRRVASVCQAVGTWILPFVNLPLQCRLTATAIALRLWGGFVGWSKVEKRGARRGVSVTRLFCCKVAVNKQVRQCTRDPRSHRRKRWAGRTGAIQRWASR
jgi:hypothetical protein